MLVAGQAAVVVLVGPRAVPHPSIWHICGGWRPLPRTVATLVPRRRLTRTLNDGGARLGVSGPSKWRLVVIPFLLSSSSSIFHSFKRFLFATFPQLTNAKLLPMPPSGRREGGGVYSVMVDGLEIARAYNGATNQTITFEWVQYDAMLETETVPNNWLPELMQIRNISY